MDPYDKLTLTVLLFLSGSIFLLVLAAFLGWVGVL